MRWAYTRRALVDFEEFLGLAELERESDRRELETRYRVRKGPMLERAVKFHAGRP